MSTVDGEVARATALIELGRPAEALRILGPHLAREPEDVTALCLSAQAHLALDRNYPALLAARAASAADPESEWAWRLQACALVEVNSYDEARIAADTAVRIAPLLYQTHTARAEIYLASDSTTEAAASAARAIELAPTVAANWLVAGNVELRRRHHRRARDNFRKALSLDPSLASARNNLAVIDMRRRRLGRAAKGFLATARANPHSEVAVRNLHAVLNYVIILMTFLVWFASAVARAQVDRSGFTGSSGRTVLVCAAGVPVLIGLLAVGYLRRALGNSFGVLIRGVMRRSRRVAPAIALLVVALGAMVCAALMPPHRVQSTLLVASIAAFAAVWTIPRRLP